jgi:hypothetical protein
MSDISTTIDLLPLHRVYYQPLLSPPPPHPEQRIHPTAPLPQQTSLPGGRQRDVPQLQFDLNLTTMITMMAMRVMDGALLAHVQRLLTLMSLKTGQRTRLRCAVCCCSMPPKEERYALADVDNDIIVGPAVGIWSKRILFSDSPPLSLSNCRQ